MSRFFLVRAVLSVSLLYVIFFVETLVADPLRLILPTRNDALLRGQSEDFYQYTDRNFNGERSYPWEGGQYGFVRNQKATRSGIVFTRFHEGVDIKPLYRDRRGEPLDTVVAVDKGVVVYVNRSARASSYGLYVVVEHIWSGSPFYSLYAHLGEVHVRMGQRVMQGDRVGRMGYTGRGINRRRAHVHFEINMLLSRHFIPWHDAHFRTENEHGIFNGINLAGLDVAELYLELERNPNLTIDQFILNQKPFFTVILPNEHPLDIQYRYPWLSRRGYKSTAPSLEVGFTRSGLPIRVESTYLRVSGPILSKVEWSDYPYALISNHLLTGSANDCSLDEKGYEYLDLLTLRTEPGREELRMLSGPGRPGKATIHPTENSSRVEREFPSSKQTAGSTTAAISEPDEHDPGEDGENGGNLRQW